MVNLDSFLLNSLLSFLPIIFWFYFFYKQDIHPEPKKYLLLAFILGILITLPIFFIQLNLSKISSQPEIKYNFFYILTLAFIEEIFKFIVVYLIIAKKPIFDEPIDALIYLISVALGLAFIENVFIVLNKKNLFDISQILSLRFIGANLVHILSSGFLGYQWAIGIIKKQIFKRIVLGLIYATLIHTTYNFIILKYINYQNLVFSATILLISLLILIFDINLLKKNS